MPLPLGTQPRRPSLADIVAQVDGPSRPSLDEIVARADRGDDGRDGYGLLADMGDRLGSLAKSAFRGATLNFGDEAVNAVRALPAATGGLEKYADRFVGLQNATDNAARRFATDHPVQDLGAQMAGGLLTGKMLPVPKTLPTGIQRIAASGGVGAVAGGLAGAGQPGQGESRAESAVQGAVMGGVGGAVVGAGAEGFRSGAGFLRRVLGFNKPPEVVERYLAEAGPDALQAAEARAATEAGMGKVPTAADAMGKTGLRLGLDAGSKSPEAADVLSAFGKARTAPVVAAREATDDIAAALGIKPKGTILTERTIDAARKEMASKVYPVLRQDLRPIEDQAIADILTTDLGRQAYARAAQLAHTDTQVAGALGKERVPFMPIFDGEGRLSRMPNLATLDWIKRGMDDLTKPGTALGEAAGQGQTLKDAEIHSLRALRSGLLRRLDALAADNPTLAAYRDVRVEQTQAHAVVEAMEQGLKRFKGGNAAAGAITDDLTQLGSRATAQGLDGDLLIRSYQQAAVDALVTRTRGGNPVTLLQKPNMVRQLRELQMTPAQVADLMERVGVTGDRQALGQRLASVLGGGDDHVGGNFAASGADAVTGNAPGGARNMFKAMRPAFAAGLTRRNAPAVARAIVGPAEPMLADVSRVRRGQTFQRQRFDREALVAFLLGQQAGAP